MYEFSIPLTREESIWDDNYIPRSNELVDRKGWYDPIVLSSLRDVIEKQGDEFVTLDMFVVNLKPGMILGEPLYSTRESLLLSAGQEITMSLILRLINFAEAGFITKKVKVSVPAAIFQEEVVAA